MHSKGLCLQDFYDCWPVEKRFCAADEATHAPRRDALLRVRFDDMENFSRVGE
jgi:hypothetical protein